MRIHDVLRVSLLKPYYNKGRALPQPPLEVIDDEPEWEVDRILDHTVIKHKKASKCMLEATAARNTVADVLLINQSSGSNTLGCCIGKACKLASISVAANFNHANC
ncbi:TPA: hypothetical protein ACH3X3_004297 [Trebouxia sp. C0006]